MHLIHVSLAAANSALPEVALRVERTQLAKRRWRGVAEDGTEFGFELESPLKPGETVYESQSARYVVHQMPEAVLEVALDMPPSAAVGIGWAVGNLHLELQSEATRLRALDEPAVRQLFERLKVPFVATTAVFRPGRFVRGNQNAAQELGASHKHGEPTA